MFSQFRQAVESLAPVPRTSLDGQPTDVHRDSSLSRSNSLDSPSPMSSSQLAESALSNLRKSLVTQRSNSTGSGQKNASPTPPREGRTKSRLEDRLRAATSAISEPSRSPDTAQKASPLIASAVSSHPVLSETHTPDSSSPSPEPMAVVSSNKAVTGTVHELVDNISESTIPQPELTTTSPLANPGEPVGEAKVANLSESPQPSPSTSEAIDNFSKLPDVMEDSVETEPTPVPPGLTEHPVPVRTDTQVSTPPLPHDSSPGHSESDVRTGNDMSPAAMESITVADTLEKPSPSDGATVSDEAPTSAPVDHKPTLGSENGVHVEELQEKLRLIEQRFANVSISFKRLQEEKQAADSVLREVTPLESVHDGLALGNYVRSLTSKTEVFQDEIKRLNNKLETQEDRLEELRDAHRLESSSQSTQIEKLQTQLSETEALLKAAHSVDARAEEVAAGHRAETEQLQKELERAKLSAKEEEEKRVKAISLLKTVRQKLVKAEKERDETTSAAALTQERERSEREKEQVERSRLRGELDAANLDKERGIVGLKVQFDKEMASFRDRYDREIATSKAQYEDDQASIKNAHTQELSARDAQIRSLQQSLGLVTTDKNAFFDDLQLRQAELESAQSHLESLDSQNTEYQYQLRELNDRYALLKDDFAEAQRDQEARAREPTTSSDEVARLLSATESKYESKLFDLRKNLMAIEKERTDSEADWSRKLRDKTREVEDLRRLADSVAQTKEQHEAVVTKFKDSIAIAEGECRLLQGQVLELRQTNASIQESEKLWKSQQQDLNSKATALEQLVEESKQRESQLRVGNKTLREELRKVQSSAALLERQRNPGVGYWTSRSTESNPTASQVSVNSPSSGTASPVASPEPSSGQKTGNDEEVNLEYLRNVILQFLEHKEMRPNLVKVLSIILHFTPQETRRLVAKV